MFDIQATYQFARGVIGGGNINFVMLCSVGVMLCVGIVMLLVPTLPTLHGIEAISHRCFYSHRISNKNISS